MSDHVSPPSGDSATSDQLPETSPRAGGRRKRHRRRRRTRRKILISLAVVLMLVVGAGAYGYYRLAGSIKTFDSAGISKHRPKDIPGTDILLIGSDTRSGKNSKLGGGGDSIGRSDTTILVHVYPGAKSAVAVSIPRDSLVTIPPCRLPNGTWTSTQANAMFNSAFTVGLTAKGNPACTVNTVEKMTGLRIDHTVVVNFEGFASMSKAIGGVPVCLPKDIYQGDLDPNLHAQGKLIFTAGRQLVSGAKALDYVRFRHGLGDNSDIGRMKRQQAFMSSLIMSIKDKGLTASHILPLVKSATSSMTFDSSLSSPTSLYSFARQLEGLDPKKIDFLTVPWRYDGARIAIVQPDADELWAALRADRPLVEKKKAEAVTAADTTTGTQKTTKPKAKTKKLPTSITDNIRKATTNLCSDLSYG
jgi:LCP family protein required for cell wall assembly